MRTRKDEIINSVIWLAVIIGCFTLFVWYESAPADDPMTNWQAFCQPSFTADQCRVLYAVKMDSDIPPSDRIVVQNTPTLQPKLGLSQ